MTPDHVRRLLAQGEGLTVEFKESVDELNATVFETVCSFSNRYGGHILLGIRDDGAVLGVNPQRAAQIKKNFVTVLNNPQKFTPTLYLTLDDVIVDGKLVLVAYVPVSSQVEFCNGRIYDRTQDADIDVTRSADLATNLFIRKSTQFTEREIFPYASLDDLRPDAIDRARRLAANNRSPHPWADLDDLGLLRSAGLYEEDRRTGRTGINLAGILLFGRDEVIRSCAPGYVTDALVRRENVDRYDDRLIVTTNLIDAFDQLMGFIEKHTLDRFYLDGAQRISLRSLIAREVVANTLVHREYSSTFPAKVVVTGSELMVENWNRSNLHGQIDPADFTPQPKNPLLAWFFVNIGRADLLGSGVRNLVKYTSAYSGGEPELIEGDVFRTIIPLASASASAPQVAGRVPSGGVHVSKDDVGVSKDGVVDGPDVANAPGLPVDARILAAMATDPKITFARLAAMIGLDRRTIQRRVQRLKERGRVRRLGPVRSGYWEVIEEAQEEPS